MQGIQDFIDQGLIWMQPDVRARRFELRSGGEVLATLTWRKGHGSLADAEAAEGRWTFKRSGFLHPRIKARASGSDETVATFESSWRGDGWLVLAQGARFRWVSTNLWQTEWALADTEGALMRFKPRQSLANLVKHEAQLELEPRAHTLLELPLLVLLGWYIIVLSSEDVAASAGGAVAAAMAGTVG